MESLLSRCRDSNRHTHCLSRLFGSHACAHLYKNIQTFSLAAACTYCRRLSPSLQANVHLHPTLQALRFACASVQHTAGLAPSGAATASRASAKYLHTLRRACRRMAAPSLVAPTALSAPGNQPRSGLRLCSLTPARKRLQGVSSWSQTPPSSPSLPPHPRPPFHENHRLPQNPVPITTCCVAEIRSGLAQA